MRHTNVKSLIKVLQHGLFCHVCNRSLRIISSRSMFIFPIFISIPWIRQMNINIPFFLRGRVRGKQRIFNLEASWNLAKSRWACYQKTRACQIRSLSKKLKIPNTRLKYERNLKPFIELNFIGVIKPRKRENINHFKAMDFCMHNCQTELYIACDYSQEPPSVVKC